MSDITRQTKLTRVYDDYYEPLMLRSGSVKTRELYHISIRHFERFLGRDAVIRDFSDDTLARYAAHRRRLPRSIATVNGEVAKLRSLWTFVCKRGIVKVWPTIALEPEPVRIPIAWLRSELEQLWQACRTMTGRIGNHSERDFWYALVLLIWDSSERIGAVLQLEWSNLSGNWLRVPAEFRKGGIKERAYELHPDTIAALMKLKRPGELKIFAWPYSRDYLWHRWRRVLKEAGLSANRKSAFHCIRRSHASHAEAAGMNATELLGHDSRKTTMGYLDPRIVTKRSPVDVLFRPGTAPEGI